jgi:hypothetical protein
VWSQQGSKLVGTGAVDWTTRAEGWAGQGCSVALSADGNTAIVGGFGDNNFAGAAWVFTAPLPNDRMPPVTTATRIPRPNANGWNHTTVIVNLNATDNRGGSGVKEIHFALGGAQNSGWQTVAQTYASVTISAQGTTVLSYFATDNSGNVETTKTLTVRIDKTPPVVSGLPAPGCTIWPPNHKLVQVATIAANGALSGIEPGSFRVTGTKNPPADGQIVISGGPNQFTVRLRADKGEIYTLTATATDRAGNTKTSTATCTVSHD